MFICSLSSINYLFFLLYSLFPLLIIHLSRCFTVYFSTARLLFIFPHRSIILTSIIYLSVLLSVFSVRLSASVSICFPMSVRFSVCGRAPVCSVSWRVGETRGREGMARSQCLQFVRKTFPVAQRDGIVGALHVVLLHSLVQQPVLCLRGVWMMVNVCRLPNSYLSW